MKKSFFISLFVVCAVVICGIVSIGAGAAEPAPSMSYVRDIEFASDGISSGSVMLDENFSGNWNFFGDVLRSSKHIVDSVNTVQMNLKNSPEGKISAVYSGGADMSKYSALSFAVNVSSDKPKTGYCRVITELFDKYGEAVVYSSVYVELNKWQLIIINTAGCEYIDKISISFDYSADIAPDKDSPESGASEKDAPERIRIATLCAGQFMRKRFCESYLTPEYKAENGEVRSYGRSVVLYPSEGSTYLDGKLALDKIPVSGTQAFMLVTLSGEISGGTLTASLLDAYSESGGYTDTAPVQLQNGRYVYSFPFTASESLVSYRLSFRNAVCSSEGIKIESVAVEWTDSVSPKSTGLGYISTVSFDKGSETLSISGIVAQSAMAEHINDALVLYAIPYSSKLPVSSDENGSYILLDELSAVGGVELMRSKLSMNFEFTINKSLAYKYIGTYMFFAALEGERTVPLSNPRGVDGAVNSPAELSIVGIDGASAVGVFESNASHVIVEVPLKQLIQRVDGELDRSGSALNTVTISGNGTVADIYLNSKLLNSINAEISFYKSAGIDVYIQITYENAGIGSVISLDFSSLSIYSRVIAYLASQNEGIAGVIIGEAQSYTMDMFGGGAFNYTVKLAELMRVTYSTLKPYVSSDKFCLVVPYRDSGEYNNVINQMLSVNIEQKGTVPWCILYRFDSSLKAISEDSLNFEGVIPGAQTIIDMTLPFGIRTASSVMFYYEPYDFSGQSEMLTVEKISKDFEFLCEHTEKYNPRAVFLSVYSLNDDFKEALYRTMKYIRPEDKNSLIEDFAAMYSSGNPAGSYAIWDFSNSYYTYGWVAGGEISSCGTGWSEIFSAHSGVYSRALQTAVTPDYDNGMASAIVLRNFDRPVDLSGVDTVTLNFALSGTAEKSSVIFTLGNDLGRAEYYLDDVAPGEVHSVSCELDKYSRINSVLYIGIMVYSGDSAVLELSDVRFESDTLTDSEIREKFKADSVINSDSYNMLYVYVVTAIVLAVTVCVLIISFRHDREREETEQKKRLPERRRYYR